MLAERKFGIEAELMAPGRHTPFTGAPEQFARKFHLVTDDPFGHKSGIFLINDIYLTEDGSLSSCGRGIEIQTRPFSLEEGEYINNLKDFFTALHRDGFYISQCCGLHVHIATPDFNSVDIAALTAFYYEWDRVIMSVISHERWSNRFCRSLSKPKLDILLQYAAEDGGKMFSFVTRRFSRYLMLNITLAAMGYGHIEIRGAPGMINVTKMLMWARFHLHIFEYIITTKPVYKKAPMLKTPTLKNLNTLLSLINVSDNLKNYILGSWRSFHKGKGRRIRG